MDVDVGKTQQCEACTERLADTRDRGRRHFRQRSKDHFVIRIGKCMRAKALDDFGAHLAIEIRGAKCGEELPLDFGGGWMGLRVIHYPKVIVRHARRGVA